MATGRDYLQSIMAGIAKLQNESDDWLYKIEAELQEIDADVDSTIDLLIDLKEESSGK